MPDALRSSEEISSVHASMPGSGGRHMERGKQAPAHLHLGAKLGIFGGSRVS